MSPFGKGEFSLQDLKGRFSAERRGNDVDNFSHNTLVSWNQSSFKKFDNVHACNFF